MLQGRSKYVPLLSIIVDVFLLILSFVVAKNYVFEGVTPNRLLYLILGAGAMLLWAIIAVKRNLYELPRILFIHKILSNNLSAIVIFTFLSGGLIFFVTDYKYSRFFFGATIIVFTVFILSWRIISIFLLKIYRRRGYNYRKIVVIGYNSNVQNLIDKVYLNPNYGFQIAGVFTRIGSNDHIDKYYKGGEKELFPFLEDNTIDEMVLSIDSSEKELINKILEYADNNMIRVRIIPRFATYLHQNFSIEYTENVPILQMRREPLQSLTNRMFKRGFDVAFSVFLILFVFSWLFPIIALIIKLSSRGPVFFVQDRTGKEGASFKCFKFRSMVVNANSDKVQASKKDTRITKFGAFMRKTSLDELPQIFNVIKNDMSLVGPRPHMLKHTDEYRLLVDKFMVRHFAKPGVTGWAQINGFRGETKTLKDMENRAEADIWYIENWSFLLDLKIVFTTAYHMFFKKDENAF